MTPRILIIAGSDSGGGAGIQADIKTVTMLGGHAMTAITAVTAQNTLGVQAVHPIPTDIVLAQVESCLVDIGADAIKIGMIGSAETAAALAERLAGVGIPIVFDPVMVATSGATLADDATIAAFGELMRISTIATPNLPELAKLSQNDEPVGAALDLVSRYGCAILIKGGHENGKDLVDALIETDNMTSWQSSRIDTRHNHGTGCTLASAIATFLASGMGLQQATDRARLFVRIALHEAPGLGSGSGPLGQGNVRLDVSPTMRLNQVTLGFGDYAASTEFYRALGLRQIVDDTSNYARFEAPGGVTLSLEYTDNPAGDATVYFECDALDDMVMRLSKMGLAFDHPPVDQSWMWREARLRDPHGNIICLYQAGENRRYPPWRL